MLRAGKDRALAQPAVPASRVIDHALRVAPPATPAQGVLRAGMTVEVEHRREVEIEAEQAQLITGEHPARALRFTSFAASATAEGITGAISFVRVTCPPSWSMARIGSCTSSREVIGQLAGLHRAGDVPAEEDEARWLELPEEHGFIRCEFQAADAEQEQMTIHHAPSSGHSHTTGKRESWGAPSSWQPPGCRDFQPRMDANGRANRNAVWPPLDGPFPPSSKIRVHWRPFAVKKPTEA